jgi:hypothetical protein
VKLNYQNIASNIPSPGWGRVREGADMCDPSGYSAWKFEENPIQTFSSGNPGIFRINWNTNYGSDMSTAGSYNYNWSTGQYYNSSGAVVSWNEVFVNYVQPNSICIYNASSSSFSNKRNRQGPQKNQQNNIKGNNLLANIRKAILDQGGMMFYGTLEQVLGLDDNPDNLTSEDLCKVFLQSFQEYYDLFAQGNLVYYGPEEIALIADWIISNSELYPNSKYFDQFPTLIYSNAIINTLVIYNPVIQEVDPYFYPNPPVFNNNPNEGYPYFSYSTYSTDLEYLHFPPIPTNINGNEYLFRIQWRIPNALF